MKLKKYFIPVIILAIFVLLSFSGNQTHYSTGLLFDEVAYNKIPLKARQVSRSYEILPEQVSLKWYAPIPQNQGHYGTCVGWSTAYGARTISESIALDRENRNLTTKNAFSPIFTYISVSNDYTGMNGTYIGGAFDLMKNIGVPRRLPIELTTYFPQIDLSVYQSEKMYRILDYARLFPTNETEYWKVSSVKKSLSENKPVVFGMWVPYSFNTAQDLWTPAQYEDYSGSHAMVVVGYDNNKYGGAFEILNSWGTDWGNDGYIWIRYEDFAYYVNEAYELIEDFNAYQNVVSFSGSVSLKLFSSNEEMPVSITNSGVYRVSESFPSGTEFQIYLQNDNPAYVYAFASDSATGKVSKIFPYDNSVSAVLNYASNTIVYPGENARIQMDSVTGTDYLIVLYSKYELPFDEICKRFENSSENFVQRVSNAVGNNFVTPMRAIYSSDEIAFSTVTNDENAVFAILIEIPHHEPIRSIDIK